MTFLKPDFLLLGIAVAILVAVASWVHARRRRRLARFLGGTRAARRLSRSDLYRLRLERILLLGAATLAVAGAAAEPHWPKVDQPAAVRSVVLAIDVSASMQASDVPPTRLAQAVEVADEIVGALGDDRVGLLLFAGSSYPLAPPTRDHAALTYYLGKMTPTMASAHDPGTLLSVGIRAAAALWTTEPDLEEERTIILVSDGDTAEDEGTISDDARAASAQGIRIYTVGVGTAQGSGMVMPTAPYQLGGPVVDANGVPATSRLDETILEGIAETGGGRYVRADDDSGLEALEGSLVPGEVSGPPWARYDLVVLLILAALTGLLAESLLDVRPPAVRGGPAWRITA